MSKKSVSKESTKSVSEKVSKQDVVKSAEKVTTKPTKNVNPDNLEKTMEVVPITDFDFSRIMYSDPEVTDIPNGGGKARRVHINYQYSEKTYGPLFVQLPKCYAFSVQANNVDKDGKIMIDEASGSPKILSGYKVPLVLTSKEPTAEELQAVEFLDNLKLEFQRYAIENKEALGKKAKSDDSVGESVAEIVFRKREEDGSTIVEGISPKLYPSLMYYHKKKEMATVFYDSSDNSVDPLTVEGSFYVIPTLKIESLWVAAKAINPQIKIYDATIEPVTRGPRKRLAPAAKVTVKTGNSGDGDETNGEDNGEGPQSDGEN